MYELILDNGEDCAEVNILDERGGETSCRKTVGWRIVLGIENLVLLVLWSGSMDDGCDLVTQTIHFTEARATLNHNTLHTFHSQHI